MILAIDPGPTHSAFVLYDPNTREVGGFGKWENERLIGSLRQAEGNEFDCVDVVAIERIASYGMPVGAEVFDTCIVIGRLVEAWWRAHELVYRREVKLHLCGSARAKDGNVRQALIDSFGGKAAIGTKKQPGPLYGVKADCWAALGVAVTYAEARLVRAA